MTAVVDGSLGFTAPSGAIYNGLQVGTPVSPTSGTSVTFTNIPNWVKRVTVVLNNVSLSSGNLQVQVGSGSVSTSGYLCAAVGANSGGTGNTGSTSGFVTNLSSQVSGAIILTLVSSNTWSGIGLIGTNSGASMSMNAGVSPTLSGALDRVVVTSLSGSATFSAGTINIIYE